ncbi:MAG TPA: TonB-dependent receptor, partial [Vicinamibacterales bacterium]|nr:TonB-dependent receptor [Vicinamibacterales bacterium]
MRHKLVILAMLGLLLAPVSALAQSTGAIAGKVIGSDGGPLPGVTVEAAGTVLPAGRMAVSGANGEYRLEALPPGEYKVTFTLSGMQTVTRTAQVQLSQDTLINPTLSVQGVTETVNVTATASLIDPGAATIKSGVSAKTIAALPVGSEYRDLLKLIPGVQYSQDTIRGPSAGGSGQDNIYQFDGVNVTRPLFGSLSAEPSSHDIEQVTTIKGGARAINFDRSGGFTIDTISKSGSSHLQGELAYKFQTAGMASDLKSGQISQYEQKKTWITAGLGGQLIPQKAFFYGSYFRPEITRENRANLYGELPQYERERNEYFGKITLTPIRDVLLNVSYRDSKRIDTSSLFLSNASSTTGSGEEATQKVTIAEGSWVIGQRSFATAKYTRMENENLGK